MNNSGLIVISSTIVKTAMIMSLNVGADDYVTSCDSPLVIAAKVKAQLRRYTKEYGSYRQLTQKML